MLWYTKTELRQGFLALVEEKQPLLWVTQPGESSTLGTRGQQKIMKALRKRAANLRSVLDRYNQQVDSFRSRNPDRVAPPTINYSELIALQADDLFWNDGLFTNANEPWAVEPRTQQGIRRLAYFNRALEEIRRLGWESRRAMQWATERHTRLLVLYIALIQHEDDWIEYFALQNQSNAEANPLDDSVQPLIPPTVPVTLRPLLQHPYLEHPLKDSHQFSYKGPLAHIASAIAVIHMGLIEITSLQLDWNDKMQEVFERTQSQTGDSEIFARWNQQVKRIKRSIDLNLFSYFVEKGFDQFVRTLRYDVPDAETANLIDGDEEDTIDLEEAHIEDIEQILSTTMLADLAQEFGVEHK
ncbi:hypothetical protein PtB15_10B367 [Puccinia triticina]|nr:hypothetical protein PtB15_10B367 [Puccinia triticina]